MCSLQRNYDVIRNWERFETGPLTVLPFWESVIVLCFVVRYFMSILVLQSS